MLDSYEMNRASEMRAKGWGNQTIANILGRSLVDIQEYFDPTLRTVKPAVVSGGKPVPTCRARPTRGARDEVFTKMWNAGVSISEITSATGIPRNSIFKLRQRLGLASRHNRRPLGEVAA